MAASARKSASVNLEKKTFLESGDSHEKLQSSAKIKRNIKMFPVRAVGVNSLLKEREGKKKKRERERKRRKKNEKPVIERLHPGFQKLWHYFIAVQFSLDLLSKESFRAPKKCRVKSCFECGQSTGNHWQRVTGNICRGNDETAHDSSAGSRNQPRVRPLSEVAFRRNAQKTGVDRLYPGIQNLKRGVAHLAAADCFYSLPMLLFYLTA